MPCKVHDVRVAALDAHYKFKTDLIQNEKNKPRFRVDMISRGRGAIPPVFGHRIIPLVRGMG